MLKASKFKVKEAYTCLFQVPSHVSDSNLHCCNSMGEEKEAASRDWNPWGETNFISIIMIQKISINSDDG